MMTPTLPNSGGSGGGDADLGPINARVDGMAADLEAVAATADDTQTAVLALDERVDVTEAFGVDGTEPAPAETRSTPVTGIPATTLGSGFPTLVEGDVLSIARFDPDFGIPFPALDVQLSQDFSFTDFAMLASVTYGLTTTLVVDGGTISLHVSHPTHRLTVSGVAGDKLGMSGVFEPGTAVVRRIATTSDVADGDGTLDDTIDALRSSLESVRAAYTTMRIKESENLYLYNVLYDAGRGGVRGFPTRVQFADKRYANGNFEFRASSGYEDVTLEAAPELAPLYAGTALTVVSVAGAPGAWTVTVGGVSEYMDWSKFELGDHLVVGTSSSLWADGGDDEAMAGIHEIVAFNQAARTLTVTVTGWETIAIGPIPLEGRIFLVTVSGGDNSYYRAVWDIQPGAVLGGIEGIVLKAPAGQSCAALRIDGELRGGAYSDGIAQAVACIGGTNDSAGVDIGPSGRCSAGHVVATTATGNYNGAVRSRGGSVHPRALVAAGSYGYGVSSESGGAAFSAAYARMLIRGNRYAGVYADFAGTADIRGQQGIAGNGKPGSLPQVSATNRAFVRADGTSGITFNIPVNTPAADGAYIARP